MGVAVGGVYVLRSDVTLPVCCRLRELSNLGWLLHLEKLFVGMNRIQVRTCVCVCVCVSVTHTPAHAYTCTHMRTHMLCDNVAGITREGASTCHLSLCRSFQIWMSCVL